MNIKKRVVLISAELKTLSQVENVQRTARLGADLMMFGLGYKRAFGSYNGSIEKSFVVDASEDTALEHLRDLASEYGQESILVVQDDANRSADLFFTFPKTIQRLGSFQAITALESRDLESWSLVDNQYYGIVK